MPKQPNVPYSEWGIHRLWATSVEDQIAAAEAEQRGEPWPPPNPPRKSHTHNQLVWDPFRRRFVEPGTEWRVDPLGEDPEAPTFPISATVPKAARKAVIALLDLAGAEDIEAVDDPEDKGSAIIRCLVTDATQDDVEVAIRQGARGWCRIDFPAE